MARAIARGIPVRDTILWVEDTGEEHLPPILCLHSLFLDGRMFDALVDGARERFRVVRPDFRAQGSSAPATGDVVDMDCCAEDIIALVEQLNLERVAVTAASMGGDVAIRAAARRPDLFAALAMMGSSVRSEPPAQKAHFQALLDRTRESGFAGEDLDMLMSIMFGASTRARPSAQPMLDHWRRRIGLLSRSVWPAMYGVVERTDATALLQMISLPTLVYSSAEDIARPVEWSREVAEGISGARLVPLAGVGHSPILEVPEIVVPQVLDFFAQAPRVA